MAKGIFPKSILFCTVLVLPVRFSSAQTPTINTVVGGGVYSVGAGIQFAVGNPAAVATDLVYDDLDVPPKGTVYIADPTHGAVYSVTTYGALAVVAGNGLPGDSTYPLREPTGLAVDSAGNLFIADYLAGMVYEVPKLGGGLQRVAGCGTINDPACFGVQHFGDGGQATSAYLVHPASVYVDGSGNLFIADAGACLIREVIAGIIYTVAGSTCGFGGDGGPALSAQLSNPSGVVVDGSGNIFIADTDNGRIRMVCASLGGTCGAARGTIQTVAGSGIANGSLGDGGSATLATLSNPHAITLDGQGNLYIADTGNNRIRLVSSGFISTFAGNGIAGYTPPCSGCFDEGVPTQASLNAPTGVAFGGNLLIIADSLNQRVRAVDWTDLSIKLFGTFIILGDIGTIAGYGVPDYIPDGYDPTSFQMGTPLAVTEDAAFNIYVGETPPRILEVTPSLSLVKPVAGTGVPGTGTAISGEGPGPGPALSAQLEYPTGLFLDSSDNVFLVDGLGGFYEINAASNVIATVSFGGLFPYDGFYGLTGHSANNLYLSTPYQLFSSLNLAIDTEEIVLLGGGSSGYPFGRIDLGDDYLAGRASFGNITGLCLDSSGNIFITDDVTLLVRVVNSGSETITVDGVTVPPGYINTIAGGGNYPYDSPPANSLDHLYYTSQQLGDGGPATSAFIAPAGCFVDNLGNLFIADEYNDRVRRVDFSTGIITTVAGLQFPGLTGDGGPAANASLNLPNSVWGDQDGHLLISDSGNHRIREITGLLPVPNASVSCNNCSLTNLPGSSTTAVVTLTNTGAAPLVISTGPSLSDSKDFTTSQSSCPIGLPGLAANKSCTVSVTAIGTVPAGATVANANLVFHDNASLSNTNGSSGPTVDPANAGQLSGYLQAEPITFTSYSPTANFSPLNLVFTAENVAQPIVVQNTGSVILNISSVTVPAGFAFQTNPPSDSCSNSGAAFSVQPMSSCNIYIVFGPPTSGGAGANPVVTIIDNAAISQQIVPVIGYALVPSGKTSFSISSGAPAPVNATFSLVGIPSSASVTPVCVITPAGLDVNCTYSASSQSINASVSIPSCLETSNANVAAHSGGAGYLSIGVVGFALLLPWGRSTRKRLLSLIAVALLSCVVFGSSACSSSNQVSSSCVASVSPGTSFNLNVIANPTTAGQFPSLTLTTPDVINVTQ